MGQSWVETETSGCDLGDVRLNRRLGALVVHAVHCLHGDGVLAPVITR